MKYTLWLLALTVFADPLPRTDRDLLLKELQTSRQQFLASIDGLSTAQWNFKPDEKSWSVAEVSEHIALAEDLIFERVTKQIMGSPAQQGKKSSIPDAMLLKAIPDRSQKFQAPEQLQPKHQFADRAAVTAAFEKSRARTMEYARSTAD